MTTTMTMTTTTTTATTATVTTTLTTATTKPSMELEAIPLPPELGRDALFYTHSSNRSQVEFVVDNQTVAGLANATVAISNTTCAPAVHIIRRDV